MYFTKGLTFIVNNCFQTSNFMENLLSFEGTQLFLNVNCFIVVRTN